MLNDIRTRTFGVEIEMCNVERSKVLLPEGYTWSKDEEIVNTDGSSKNGFGGEVNTPPLNITKFADLHTLKSVYESMVQAGGKLKWSIYTHVHIYVGDLEVEDIKKLFLFLCICYPYIKKYAEISPWDEILSISMPIPTDKYYEGVLKANTFGELKELFTNNSTKGYIRHAINISSYFKTQTVEYRTFHATDDFYMAMNCVYSAYRMFYYAINHTLDDFKAISSYEEFCKVTKLKYTTPPVLIPLLYQGNPYSKIESYQTKPLSYNSKMTSVLSKALEKNNNKDLCIVNGFMYYYELFFLDKVNVSIYCQDAYCYLLHEIANGNVVLRYNGKLGWLEEYNNNTCSRQLALALYAAKLQKFFMSESDRNRSIFESLKLKAKESIEKTEKANDRLMRLLTTCEFHVGTLNEALQKNKVVFFNYGRVDKTQKRTFKLIRDNSDLDMDFSVARNDYYNIVESIPTGTYFYYFSNSPYLSNMHKIAMLNSSNGDRWSAGKFLYSNQEVKKTEVSTSYSNSNIEVNEVSPPDDLAIDDPKKLKILKVKPSYLRSLQKKYIKKVDQVSLCTYPYIVKYDKYTLGGFGFTLPQHSGYDLFQLTDFATNNNIPRLSKLILYCIQSEVVQMDLSRRMHKLCEKVISIAYTHKPVSMKYRGVYKKNKEHSTSSYLAYDGVLGVYKTMEEIISKYQKSIK